MIFGKRIISGLLMFVVLFSFSSLTVQAQGLGGLLGGGDKKNPLGGLQNMLGGDSQKPDPSGEKSNPLGGLLNSLGGGGSKETGKGGGLGSGFNLGMAKDLIEAKEASKLGPVGRFVLGRALAARVLGANKAVSPADPRVSYVRKITLNLMVNSRYYGNYKDPVVILLDDDTVANAYAAPGGFVFVTTGLLNFVKNEDELAFVLAHEIAHIELDHGLNAIVQGKGGQFAKEAFGVHSGDFFAMMENGYGKDIETEADIRGAELSAKTGYDYQAGIDVINRLEKNTSHKHATGYPSHRAESLKMGAKKSSSASAKAGQLRNARFKGLIK